MFDGQYFRNLHEAISFEAQLQIELCLVDCHYAIHWNRNYLIVMPVGVGR